MDQNQLVRASLGRVGFLGELYDARSESFSSKSLIQTEALSSLTKKTDVHKMESEYEFTENWSDRFSFLNIKGELQVCLLSELVSAEGSGKFLKKEKKSHKSTSCSLLCKFVTVSEKIFGSLSEYEKDLDLSLLKNNEYTHLITEITWGADCILNLEANFESDQNKLDVQGNLKAKLTNIASQLKADGSCDVKNENKSNQLSTDIKISITADVLPERKLETSIEGFCSLISDLPNLIKNSNNGKGKPLLYTMIPLSKLRNMFKIEMEMEIVIKKIDEAFLISTVYFFEEISDLKLKISDLIDLLQKNKKYVSKGVLSEASQQFNNLKEQESSLKELLSQNWVDVRSGSKNLRDLVKEVEKFKNCKLQLFQYEEYLDSVSEILKEIDEITIYTSKGVTYLGRGESSSHEFIKNISCTFIVLVKSKKFKGDDPQIHEATCNFFCALVEERSQNTKYLVIDLDYVKEENSSLFSNITRTTCVKIEQGKITNSDLLQDYLFQAQSNFVKIREGEEMDTNRHKHGNRVNLVMTCPGLKSTKCSSEAQVWICFFCKNNIEYDFHEYFHCTCGKAKTTSFEYRCSDSRHGPSFISPSQDFLTKELSALKPFPEINILILGQTGVGKSTWINSIVNYMQYDSLSNARQGGAICTIPIRFAYHDSTGKEYDIKLGEPDDGEVLQTGLSATQFCRTYSFSWKGKFFRLIDTPGIGDVRGIDKDKENMKHIVDYIGYLQELHGVCILLKANESKLGAVFSYCLKELLVHLHKSVAKNIVFCFTNARNSFYSPGQTFVLVKKLLNDLEIGNELTLGPQNSFCLDNEAFLFLCMLRYPDIKFEEDFIEDFEKSWNNSIKETYRLFDTIINFQPHLLKQTMSLCRARNKILILSKPLAEISKNIQLNVRMIEQHKREVESTQKTVEELQQKLYYEEIHLESKTISQPRTVCTSQKCVEYYNIKSLGITEIEYKTHCHVNCQLTDVTPTTINNSALKGCAAMSDSGKCKNCGCGWETHMHLLTEQKKVMKQAKSKIIEDDINKNLSFKQTKEKFVQDLQDKIRKYKEEQDIIMKISVKMGMFLKQNAITVYNDAVLSYLKCMIEEQENIPHKTTNDEILLKQLKETLSKYEKEIEILQNVVETKVKFKDVPTIEDIEKFEKILYSLELTGRDIEDYVKTQMRATSQQVKYTEVSVGSSKNRALNVKRVNNEGDGYLKRAKNYVVKKYTEKN